MLANGTLLKKKKKVVTPTVQRIIEEYWRDDDGDEPDSILRMGRERDWSAIFE